MRHGGADALKKITIQRLRRVELLVRMRIAVHEKIPLYRGDIFPTDMFKTDTGISPAPLLVDFFSFVATHRCKIVIEIGIARIAPVQLKAVAQHHALLLHFQCLMFVREKNVQ